MTLRKIKYSNSKLMNEKGEYAFKFYPAHSLLNGVYVPSEVRDIHAATPKEALTNLLEIEDESDRNTILDVYLNDFGTFARAPDKQQTHNDTDVFEHILADLYRVGYVDKNDYYTWKPMVSGLMSFDFRGHNEESALTSFAHNHRKNTNNLEPHRHSTKKFVENFKRSLRDFFGISGDGIILKDLITAGYVERIHVRQSRQYNRGHRWSY